MLYIYNTFLKLSQHNISKRYFDVKHRKKNNYVKKVQIRKLEFNN